MTTTSLKATRLDPLTLEALAAIATTHEIAVVYDVLNDLSAGHGEPWMATYLADILNRLARREPSTIGQARPAGG